MQQENLCRVKFPSILIVAKMLHSTDLDWIEIPNSFFRDLELPWFSKANCIGQPFCRSGGIKYLSCAKDIIWVPHKRNSLFAIAENDWGHAVPIRVSTSRIRWGGKSKTAKESYFWLEDARWTQAKCLVIWAKQRQGIHSNLYLIGYTHVYAYIDSSVRCIDQSHVVWSVYHSMILGK